MCRLVLLIASLLIFSGLSACDGLATETPLPVNDGEGGGNVAYQVSLMSSREFWLFLLVLFFGAVVVAVEYLLFRSPASLTSLT